MRRPVQSLVLVTALTLTPGLVLGQSSSEWRTGRKIIEDHKSFYSWEGMSRLLIGLGAQGLLAGTEADASAQSWYQDSVRGETTDSVAGAAKLLGEGALVLPVSYAAYLVARLRHRPESPLGEWGERTLRGITVGAPAVLVLQKALGSSRPSDGIGSDWHPFDDENGVSGHAFIGSVPFLAGARMCRRRTVKGLLYFASGLAAWSRINDNQHYLSQSAGGWWIGYLATRSQARSDKRVRAIALSGGLGVGVAIRTQRPRASSAGMRS